jgi:hypothetical protein
MTSVFSKLDNTKIFIMRKFSIAFILTLFTSFATLGQNIELTPLFGYHFGGTAYFSEGKLAIEDSPTFGLSIGTPLSWDSYVEFVYSRADSKANFTSKDVDYNDDSFAMATNYFLLSGNKSGGSDRVIGYGGILMGVTWFDAKTTKIKDSWNFTTGLQGGVNIYFNEILGLRLQGRLLLPVYISSGAYSGIGGNQSGNGVSISTTSAMLQGDLTIGLIIQL